MAISWYSVRNHTMFQEIATALRPRNDILFYHIPKKGAANGCALDSYTFRCISMDRIINPHF